MSFTAGAGTRFLVSTGASGTPLSGPLSITGGTATANTPVLSATQTWNNAAVTFTGWQLNVTDTASNAASLLMDLQRNGVSFFNVTKVANGTLNINTNNTVTIGDGYIRTRVGASNGFDLAFNGLSLGEQAPLIFKQVANGTTYSSLFSTASGTIEQRNGVNAQTLRVYNTFTDASNYERGRFAWVSNVLTIGTENAGTGLARELAFITGGVEQARLNSTGFGIGTNSPTSKLEVQGAGVLVSFLSTNNNNVVRIRGNNATNGAWIGTSNADDFIISTGPSVAERVRIPSNGGMVVGTAALATNATNGFLYVAGCAGTPTGTPTAYTGSVPIVVDTTNNKLYFYSGGAWCDAGP